MKYYSTVLNKLFDSEKECNKAEKEAEVKQQAAKKAAEEAKLNREADAKKVEAAYDEMVKAEKNYQQVLSDFCKKYGSYHFTISQPTDFVGHLFNLFDIL